jgi:hypothetical protein
MSGKPRDIEGQGPTSQGRGPEQRIEVSRTSLQGFGQPEEPWKPVNWGIRGPHNLVGVLLRALHVS